MEDVLAAAMRDVAAEARAQTDLDRELALFHLRVDARRSSHRRQLAVVAAAIVAVLLSVGYLLVAGGQRDAPPAEPEPSPVTSQRQLRANEILQRIELPGAQAPTGARVIDGSIWVSAESRLTRIDAATGSMQGSVSVPDTALQGPITVTPQGWWLGATPAGQDGYLRLDPSSGQVLAFAPVGSTYASTYSAAGLWVVSGKPQTIARLDPETGKVEDEVRLPERPFGLLATDRVVWAQAAIGGALYRVNTVDDTVRLVTTLQGSGPLALVDDELWVAEPATRNIVRLDAQTGAQLGRIRLPGPDPQSWEPGRPVPMPAVADDTVYIVEDTAPGLTVTRLDADTGRVVASAHTADETAPAFPAADPGGLWLPLRTDGELLRLGPLTR